MRTLIYLAASVLAAPVAAQVARSDAGQTAAVFGARERILDASLSPDGTKVALISPGPGQSTVVQVLDMKGGTATPINVAKGDPFRLTGCNWASNARLVCSLYGVSAREGERASYSRLIAMNADGTDLVGLGARERVQDFIHRSDGYVVDWRDGGSDEVLVARVYLPAKNQLTSIGSKALGLGVDLLDTRTGKAKHVESAHPRATRYLSDGQGRVRIMGTDEAFRVGWESRGETTFVYRLAGSSDWKPFGVYASVTDQGMVPIAIDGVANVAYALEKVDGRDVLYRVALDGSMRKELAFAHPKVDVAGVVRVGRRGRVVGARYSLEKPETEVFDPEYRTMVTNLGRALPRLPLISVVDSSADEKVHLIHAASDTDPGRYFLYDSAKKALSPLGQDRPDTAGMKLGQVKPVSYRAADGTMIPGYLTLPPGGAAKGLPAIVMPHGGPAARDEWGFDWLSQYYVSRGFAVLQPNFRGSSGYGEAWFEENGFRSWKTAIGDVTDAGRWLVSEGIADPSKLAIVGWSYGGYAALQSNVVDPDLFKAVVAIAPVTDLGLLRGEWGTRIARDYIGDGPQLQEGSPARHPAKFKAPVLMFHGEDDINVAANEAKVMDRALKKANKRSTLVLYPAIDHQLGDSAVRTDMLAKSDAFLRSSMGM
jgi:dienelactone hydrolase